MYRFCVVLSCILHSLIQVFDYTLFLEHNIMIFVNAQNRGVNQLLIILYHITEL